MHTHQTQPAHHQVPCILDAEVYVEPYEDWREREDCLYKPSVAVLMAGLIGMIISLLVICGSVQVWKWLGR